MRERLLSFRGAGRVKGSQGIETNRNIRESPELEIGEVKRDLHSIAHTDDDNSVRSTIIVELDVGYSFLRDQRASETISCSSIEGASFDSGLLHGPDPSSSALSAESFCDLKTAGRALVPALKFVSRRLFSDSFEILKWNLEIECLQGRLSDNSFWNDEKKNPLLPSYCQQIRASYARIALNLLVVIAATSARIIKYLPHRGSSRVFDCWRCWPRCRCIYALQCSLCRPTFTACSSHNAIRRAVQPKNWPQQENRQHYPKTRGGWQLAAINASAGVSG